LGVNYAASGKRDSARAAARRAVAGLPIDKDGWKSPVVHYWAAQAFARIGDADSALSALERVMSVPFFVSPEWLRLAPEFAALRGNPRFEALSNRVATPTHTR